jgi:hypothetical protein
MTLPKEIVKAAVMGAGVFVLFFLGLIYMIPQNNELCKRFYLIFWSL